MATTEQQSMRQETQVYLTEVAQGMTRLATQIRQDTHDVLGTKDHIEVIRHFVQLRTANETIKQAREALKEIEDNLSKIQIPDIARDLKERTGVKPPFKIEGIGSVSIANKFNCSILDHPTEGKQIGYKWLRDNEAESLVTETVNAGTLSSYAKDLLENHGKELPEDIFKISIQNYTSVRKG